MADFVLAIATVKSAYDTFLTDQAATATALTALNSAVAAQPAKPNVVAVNADWNNYITALDTWQSNVAGAKTTWLVAESTQRTAELAVIAALGYGTGDTPASIALDQWITVTGAGGGILTYTNYIGAATYSTYLVISNVLPTKSFPNL